MVACARLRLMLLADHRRWRRGGGPDGVSPTTMIKGRKRPLRQTL